MNKKKIATWFNSLSEKNKQKFAKDFFNKQYGDLTNMEVSIIYNQMHIPRQCPEHPESDSEIKESWERHCNDIQ